MSYYTSTNNKTNLRRSIRRRNLINYEGMDVEIDDIKKDKNYKPNYYKRVNDENVKLNITEQEQQQNDKTELQRKSSEESEYITSRLDLFDNTKYYKNRLFIIYEVFTYLQENHSLLYSNHCFRNEIKVMANKYFLHYGSNNYREEFRSILEKISILSYNIIVIIEHKRWIL